MTSEVNRRVRDLTTSIERRLLQVDQGPDLAPVLTPEAVNEANELIALITEDQVESLLVLGWFHCYRTRALPQPEGIQEMAAAVTLLGPCFLAIDDIERLPGPMLPLLADNAIDSADELLQAAAATSDAEIASAAVSLWKRIVTSTPDDEPGHAERISKLGTALQIRFQHVKDAADLNDAISAKRSAASATPDGSPDLPGLLMDLCGYLYLRAEHSTQLSDVNEAVEVGRRSVALTSEDDPELPGRLTNLGLMLWTRFERTGQMTDVEEAVKAGRNALELASNRYRDHPALAAIASNFAVALRLRAERTGRLADMNEATEVSRRAVELTSEDDPDLPGRLANLGLALRLRFDRTGRIADVDDAVNAARRAVTLARSGRRESIKPLINLAGALIARFESLDALPDLDEAIDVGRKAVNLAAAGDPDLAIAKGNLGLALYLRSIRTSSDSDLEEAIKYQRQAAEHTTEGGAHLPRYLQNLGLALRQRFLHTGDRADIDTAIEMGRKSVSLSPENTPAQTWRLSNLSVTLRIRFETFAHLDDLDEAIVVSRQAVRQTAENSPDSVGNLSDLGYALYLRFNARGSRDDRDEAAAVFERAAAVVSAAPAAKVRAASMAGLLAAYTDASRAAELMERAVRLLPEVVPRRLRRSDQEHALEASVEIASQAAAMALENPGQPGRHRAERALMLLEMGRAILLSQALETRNDLTDLAKTHPDLARRFEEIRSLVDRQASMSATTTGQADSHNPDLHDARDTLNTEFQQLLTEIRALPGFASFAGPPSVTEMIEEAKHGPVVVFNIDRFRSDAIVVTTEGVQTLHLPGMGYDAVSRQVTEFQRALREIPDPDRQSAACRTVTEILAWLWDNAAGPVLTTLGYDRQLIDVADAPRVWWAPGGLLSQLPIHAAGHHDDPTDDPSRRTVMDRVISSYTPTIRALRYAREQAETAGHIPSNDTTLIVGMPTTPAMKPLSYVRSEIQAVTSHRTNVVTLIEPDSAAPVKTTTMPTRANVLAVLPECAIAHFACHGFADPADPSSSRLFLHDHQTRPMTIAVLAPLQLNRARLAYLSVCETARTPGGVLVDEAITLATAFQLAGFPHVIGTLWPVNDLVAAEIATDFYAYISDTDAGLNIEHAARAIHQAIRSARDRDPNLPYLWAAHIHAGA